MGFNSEFKGLNMLGYYQLQAPW